MPELKSIKNIIVNWYCSRVFTLTYLNPYVSREEVDVLPFEAEYFISSKTSVSSYSQDHAEDVFMTPSRLYDFDGLFFRRPFRDFVVRSKIDRFFCGLYINEVHFVAPIDPGFKKLDVDVEGLLLVDGSQVGPVSFDISMSQLIEVSVLKNGFDPPHFIEVDFSGSRSSCRGSFMEEKTSKGHTYRHAFFTVSRIIKLTFSRKLFSLFMRLKRFTSTLTKCIKELHEIWRRSTRTFTNTSHVKKLKASIHHNNIATKLQPRMCKCLVWRTRKGSNLQPPDP